MKDFLKNIKKTLAQLFGFEELQEVKEWGQCLEGLEKNGYFTPAQVKDFKDSDKFLANLQVQLDNDGQNIETIEKNTVKPRKIEKNGEKSSTIAEQTNEQTKEGFEHE